jgi:hypothetical protein
MVEKQLVRADDSFPLCDHPQRDVEFFFLLNCRFAYLSTKGIVCVRDKTKIADCPRKNVEATKHGSQAVVP